MEVNPIKRSFKFIISFIFIITLLSIFSTDVNAEDSLTISRWIINSEVLENGNLKVIEDITFKFNDYYNGVFREIVLKGTNGLDNIQVSQLNKGQEIPYQKVNNAKKGDNQVFVVNKEDNSIILQIFSPSEDEEKTFRIKYIVKDVAIKYRDTGELYYKFLGEENETSIDFLGININLPGKVTDDVKIFAHGPTNGTINFSGDNTIRAEVENVKSHTFVEVRVLFPVDFIPNSSKIIDKNAHDEIIEEELSYIQELKDKEIRKEERKSLFNNISIVISGILLISMAMVFIKFKRNINIYESFNRYPNFDEVSPAVVSFLVNGSVSTKTLMATIFDLARRGFISIEGEIKNKMDSFKLVRLKGEGVLSDHEILLLKWLFDEMGDGKTIKSDDIEYYSKHHSINFYNNYNEWIKAIKKEAKERGYYDSNSKPAGIILILLSVISFTIGIVSIIFESLWGISLIAISTVAFIYGIMLLIRKSDYGYIQAKKWIDFKKNLRKMSKSKNIEDLSLSLNESLIYGLALGIDFNSLNRFKPYVYNSHMPNYWTYWIFANDSKGENMFEKSFNKSFSSIASSTGSGGSFSSGGGGGAGGGGAGGF